MLIVKAAQSHRTIPLPDSKIVFARHSQTDEQHPHPRGNADSGNLNPGNRVTELLCDSKLTDLLLALFTYCLVVVGTYQGYFLWDSGQTSRIAAEAAKKSSDTLTNAERPQITFEILGSEGIDRTAAEIIYPDMRPDTKGLRHGVRRIKYKIANHGRIPAWLDMVVIQPITLTVLPEPPIYEGMDFVGGYSVPHLIPPTGSYESSVGIQDELWGQIWKKGNQFFICGYVEYRSTFTGPHKAGFAYRYVPFGKVGFFEATGPACYWYYT